MFDTNLRPPSLCLSGFKTSAGVAVGNSQYLPYMPSARIVAGFCSAHVATSQFGKIRYDFSTDTTLPSAPRRDGNKGSRIIPTGRSNNSKSRSQFGKLHCGQAYAYRASRFGKMLVGTAVRVPPNSVKALFNGQYGRKRRIAQSFKKKRKTFSHRRLLYIVLRNTIEYINIGRGKTV